MAHYDRTNLIIKDGNKRVLEYLLSRVAWQAPHADLAFKIPHMIKIAKLRLVEALSNSHTNHLMNTARCWKLKPLLFLEWEIINIWSNENLNLYNNAYFHIITFLLERRIISHSRLLLFQRHKLNELKKSKGIKKLQHQVWQISRLEETRRVEWTLWSGGQTKKV